MGRTNSPTSARHGDDLEYIRIWKTLLRRLVFWDGAPSASIGIRSTVVCVDDVRRCRSPNMTQWLKKVRPCEANVRLSRNLAMMLLYNGACHLSSGVEESPIVVGRYFT